MPLFGKKKKGRGRGMKCHLVITFIFQFLSDKFSNSNIFFKNVASLVNVHEIQLLHSPPVAELRLFCVKQSRREMHRETDMLVVVCCSFP